MLIFHGCDGDLNKMMHRKSLEQCLELRKKNNKRQHFIHQQHYYLKES